MHLSPAFTTEMWNAQRHQKQSVITDVGRKHIITPQTIQEKEIDDLDSREDLEFINEDENIDYFSQIPDQ